MFIIIYIFMFITSSLLFWLLSISQVGTNWEVPFKIMQKCNFALVLSSLFFILSLVLLVISKDKFLKLANGIKYSIVTWIAVILIILILGWSKLLYRIPAISSMVSIILKNIFVPGLFLSGIATITLILISKKYI